MASETAKVYPQPEAQKTGFLDGCGLPYVPWAIEDPLYRVCFNETRDRIPPDFCRELTLEEISEQAKRITIDPSVVSFGRKAYLDGTISPFWPTFINFQLWEAHTEELLHTTLGYYAMKNMLFYKTSDPRGYQEAFRRLLKIKFARLEVPYTRDLATMWKTIVRKMFGVNNVYDKCDTSQRVEKVSKDFLTGIRFHKKNYDRFHCMLRFLFSRLWVVADSDIDVAMEAFNSTVTTLYQAAGIDFKPIEFGSGRESFSELVIDKQDYDKLYAHYHAKHKKPKQKPITKTSCDQVQVPDEVPQKKLAKNSTKKPVATSVKKKPPKCKPTNVISNDTEPTQTFAYIGSCAEVSVVPSKQFLTDLQPCSLPLNRNYKTCEVSRVKGQLHLTDNFLTTAYVSETQPFILLSDIVLRTQFEFSIQQDVMVSHMARVKIAIHRDLPDRPYIRLPAVNEYEADSDNDDDGDYVNVTADSEAETPSVTNSSSS